MSKIKQRILKKISDEVGRFSSEFDNKAPLSGNRDRIMLSISKVADEISRDASNNVEKHLSTLMTILMDSSMTSWEKNTIAMSLYRIISDYNIYSNDYIDILANHLNRDRFLASELLPFIIDRTGDRHFDLVVHLAKEKDINAYLLLGSFSNREAFVMITQRVMLESHLDVNLTRKFYSLLMLDYEDYVKSYDKYLFFNLSKDELDSLERAYNGLENVISYLSDEAKALALKKSLLDSVSRFDENEIALLGGLLFDYEGKFNLDTQVILADAMIKGGEHMVWLANLYKDTEHTLLSDISRLCIRKIQGEDITSDKFDYTIRFYVFSNMITI